MRQAVLLFLVLFFPVIAFGQSPERDEETAVRLGHPVKGEVSAEAIESLRAFIREKRQAARIAVVPEQSTLEVIRNGGFEQDPALVEWTTGIGIPIRSTASHTGRYCATFGIVNNELAQLYQTVTLPSGAGSASISFYLNISSSDIVPVSDVFGIQVLDTAGRLLKTLDAWSNDDRQSNLTFLPTGTYDLSAYRGLTIRISFLASNDVSAPSFFRVDDVSLRAAPSALDFTLSLSPSVVNVVQTESAAYSLDARSTVGGITINLSADSLPPGCVMQFGQGLFPIVVRIVTSLDTPPGLQSFRIRGESGGVIRFVSGQMMVVRKPTDFTAPTVRLLSPNDVKKLKRGNSVTVTWESADNVGVVRHDVFFSGDAGASFTLVGAGLGGQTKSFTYTIPSTIPKSPAGYFRVRATDEAGNSATDENDKPFKLK